MTTYPLGLPKGSVRAIIAIMLSSSFVASIFILKEAMPKALIAVFSTVIGFYFGKRSVEDKAEVNQ